MKTNWPTKKLGEVCEILIGGTPRRGISKYWDNGTLPWVSIADLTRSDLILTDTKEKITESGAEESNAKLIPEGTLIFSFKLSIGKMAFAGRDLYTNEAIAGLVVKNKKELDKKYLYYYLLQAAFDTAHKAVKGSTLNKEKIKVLKIPLPPLSEQKRIVEELEKMLEKIKEAKKLRAKSLAASESLLPAELHKIFDEGKTKGWGEKNLKDRSILNMTSGGTPSRSNSSFYNGNIIWLKSGELQDNTDITDSKEKINEAAIKESSAKIFPRGTILFAMYGATAGKIGILGVEASTNQAVAGLIPAAEKLDNKFLYYFLMKKREEIISHAWGGAQPNLSQTIIKKFKIPLPSLAEQKKIVARLDLLSGKIQKLKALQLQTQSDLDALEKSILHHAFAGDM